MPKWIVDERYFCLAPRLKHILEARLCQCWSSVRHVSITAASGLAEVKEIKKPSQDFVADTLMFAATAPDLTLSKKSHRASVCRISMRN